MRWNVLHSRELADAHNALPDSTRQAGAILVMPSTDEAMALRAAKQMSGRAGVEDALVLVVLDDEREGFIELANRAYRATCSTFFGYTAQDAFAGRRWLALAQQALTQRNKGFFGFNDGKWAGLLASFGLGRRVWLDQHYDGDLFFPGYTQHYADTELTMLAMGNGQYCHDPHAVLIEVDWDKETRPRPVNPFDKLLYAQRKTGWLRAHVAQPDCLELFQ
ncbi:hypothetical protein [Candidatus Symbiobacter mobilis]|uniref:Glycosyltransferase-like protein n=1 Tax=Candidatus Symbiobacter mobilis CR TaxID=946483 RepID=U5NA31_9BURK|nr:hypothetical protein [Candidatus Symbiobacter mobilis]AGX88391.1 hypothetical protein Cenrod_2329 [Candidatus Symbiobacter mobilis CR]